MTISAHPLGRGVGLEVTGLSLEQDLAPEVVDRLTALWREAGVLLFRGIGTSPEALLRLSRCFGTLEPHPIPTFRMEGYPELILLTNQGGARGPVYRFDGVPTYGRIPWHIDLAFKPVPNAGALLRMVQLPQHGGQTGWLDTALAYEALDEGMKRRIAGLEARYSFCKSLEGMRFLNPRGERVATAELDIPDFPPIARPLVWAHPVTGRPVLNLSALNIQSIIGMDAAESDALIQALLDHVTQPRFIYMHEWQVNDIVLWDNYRMMHCAMGHPLDEIRIVQRSTLKGEVSIGHVIEDEMAEVAA